jgi:hypothetical protein
LTLRPSPSALPVVCVAPLSDIGFCGDATATGASRGKSLPPVRGISHATNGRIKACLRKGVACVSRRGCGRARFAGNRSRVRKAGRPREYCFVCEPPGYQVVRVAAWPEWRTPPYWWKLRRRPPLAYSKARQRLGGVGVNVISGRTRVRSIRLENRRRLSGLTLSAGVYAALRLPRQQTSTLN